MRIISGIYKGRIIHTPKGCMTRPTSARVRESIFSILGRRLVGAKILDVFAGSGALGIEAISRGGERCVFVEKANNAFVTIAGNIKTLNISNASLLKQDVFHYLSFNREFEKFDIIFIDPPYGNGLGWEALKLIVDNNWLTGDGVVVMEDSVKALVNKSYSHMELVDKREYGDTVVMFYQHKKE